MNTMQANGVRVGQDTRPTSPWAPVVEKVGVPIMWITVGILIDRFVFKKKAA